MFLEIWQNSQETICVRVSFLIKKELCEISKNTFSYRAPPVAASETVLIFHGVVEDIPKVYGHSKINIPWNIHT